MRSFLAFVLSAILIVLIVVAAELVRIDRELALFGDVRAALVAAANRPPETRAQRDARIEREQREFNADAAAMFKAADAPATKQPPRKPAGR